MNRMEELPVSGLGGLRRLSPFCENLAEIVSLGFTGQEPEFLLLSKPSYRLAPAYVGSLTPDPIQRRWIKFTGVL